MLDDIENGSVNMVIVKDLSRFGREYAQMGMYIEHYFEAKGVRFISVAENIDSQNGIDNLVLPFTNVINSFYPRQSSSKTKAAHQAWAKSRMFLGARAPFGYQKNPNDDTTSSSIHVLQMRCVTSSKCSLTASAMCG